MAEILENKIFPNSTNGLVIVKLTLFFGTVWVIFVSVETLQLNVYQTKRREHYKQCM